MGLALEVGILADLKKHDIEGYAYYSKQFDAINNALQTKGLAIHTEAEDIAVWSASTFGYTGINYLKRLAAYVWYNDKDSKRELPGPADDMRDKNRDEFVLDFVLYEMMDVYVSPDPEFPETGFSHLLKHSSNEGFYLPQYFHEVLFLPKNIAGKGIIGSSVQLLKELAYLAKLLELNLASTSDEIFALTKTPQGEGDSIAEKYGIESHTCYSLYLGAKKSIELNAALVFC